MDPVSRKVSQFEAGEDPKVIRGIQRGCFGSGSVKCQSRVRNTELSRHIDVVQGAGRRWVEVVRGRRPGLIWLSPVHSLEGGTETALHQRHCFFVRVRIEVARNDGRQASGVALQPAQQVFRLLNALGLGLGRVVQMCVDKQKGAIAAAKDHPLRHSLEGHQVKYFVFQERDPGESADAVVTDPLARARRVLNAVMRPVS